MIGLDTTALIDLFRNNENIKKILEETDEEVILNQISYLELRFGLDFNNTKHKIEEEFYDNLFGFYSVLDLDFKASKKASIIFAELEKKGKTIGQLDCTMAGIYLTKNVNKIISRNKKHFENIAGIEAISY